MTTGESAPGGERERTDTSLRVERARADEALGEELAAIDETADAIITVARGRADAVLAASRARNDAKRVSGNVAPALVHERAREDQLVREERAEADQELQGERTDHAALLSVDRGATDKDLSTERVLSDAAVATRDEVMQMVSHELRGMLQSVIGFAGLIAHEALLPDQGARAQHHAQRIQRSAGRMSRLVGDLVDIASIEAGQLAVAAEPTDPVIIAKEAIESFQLQAANAGVRIVADFPSTSPPCALDPARTLQVLTNFLGNAIKFTGHGGRVTVRVEDSSTEVRFSVEDTGKGIAASDLALVFDRFHQVLQNDRRGMGLGLYISKCIVAGHGGRIWAESEEGRGSVFSFTIPRGATAREAASPTSAP